MKKALAIALLAVAAVAITAAFWLSRSSTDDGADAPAATEKAARTTSARSGPTRLGAAVSHEESEEERYLVARAQEAEAAADEIRSKHEPSEYVADPEQDYSMTIPALRRARDAYKSGNMEEALTLFEAVIAADPDKTSARHYAVEVACILGEEAVARQHVAELSDSRQRTLAKLCADKGVELPGIDWAPEDGD